MTYIVDLDGTLVESDFISGHYYNHRPIQSEIDLLNELYFQNTIIIHTSRPWIEYDITIQHLNRFGIRYHQLVMGKPLGVIIDKDAKTTLEGL